MALDVEGARRLAARLVTVVDEFAGAEQRDLRGIF